MLITFDIFLVMPALRASENVYPSSAFRNSGETPLYLIEVTSNGTNRRSKLTEEILREHVETDFGCGSHHSYLNIPPEPTSEQIKLFWSRRDGEYNGEMTPIPVSREIYTRLASYARAPVNYPQILTSRTAHSIMTTPQLPQDVALQISPRRVRDEYLSFIIQSIPGAMMHVCVGASFTYHFPTKHMYIFMHGLASVNYDRFAATIQDGAAKASAFLVPSIIVQFNLEQRLQSLNRWQDEIYWNERKLGIRFDHHDSPDPESIDYTKLSKDLNAANTNLAYLAWSCKTTERHLDFMDSIAKVYLDMAIKNGHSAEDADEVEHLLLETHAHLRSWNVGLQDRAEYLSKRGQALVQTVYSGIAQRDSAISLRLAATSTNLATTSQEVAIATSRDSAVMRVIAAITIFFLPATFTATFFSTTFFSFNGNLGGKVYSGWLWLYFVVTLLLTATVVLGTWMLWRGKEKDISRRMERKKVE